VLLAGEQNDRTRHGTLPFKPSKPRIRQYREGIGATRSCQTGCTVAHRRRHHQEISSAIHSVMSDVTEAGCLLRGVTMSRYPLNLPAELHRAAAELAEQQGVSLNQFIL